MNDLNKKNNQSEKTKDVYIVGTGIAGALIAKTLTDYVIDKTSENQSLIDRATANIRFKKKLETIQYSKGACSSTIVLKKLINDQGELVLFAGDGESNERDKANEILLIIEQSFKNQSVKSSVDKNSYFQRNFEKLYFELFYQEVTIQIFEAGLNEGLELEASKNFENYSSYMERFNNASAKVPNSPYPKLRQSDSPNVLDIEKIPLPNFSTKGYMIQKGPQPFLSDHIRVGGGTTMHWLGTTLRMLPNDFDVFKNSDNSKKDYYKWPITYEELKLYYELAEYEIGVSGDVDGQVYPNVTPNEMYGDSYTFPMKEIPQSYLDLEIIKGLGSKSVTLDRIDYPLLLTSSPQGRNSIPNDNYKKQIQLLDANGDSKIKYKLSLADDKNGYYKALGAVWNPYMGERCEGNASCVPICPVQAKYNALKSLKKACYKVDWKGELQRNENVIIQGQSVVYKLGAEVDQKISSIHLRRYEAQNKTSFKEECINTSNSIVVLAANALENPKILLNSKYKSGSEEFTVANKSDQVGRNLMDHHVMLTWGLAKEPVYPFRGPGSTTNISTFRDGEFRKDFAAWISPLDNWGWGWPAFAPGSDLEEALKDGKIGSELRTYLKEKITRQVLFHFEIEQLPNPENRITISDNYLDVLGIPRPMINYSISDYEIKALEQAKETSDQMFEILGITDYTKYSEEHESAVSYNGKLFNFNGAGHIVGTHRMGNDPKTSVTNSYCQSWEHANLYVVGAGSMVTLGTSNPTLTLAAIAIRSVESILTDLKNKK